MHVPELSTTDLRPYWTVYIDETGSDFEAGAVNNQGRVIAVLFGDPSRMPPPLVSHGTEAGFDVTMRYVRELVAHDTRIIGLTADAIEPGRTRGWAKLVLETLRWIDRMLPSGRGRLVRVVVEQRGPLEDGTNAAAWAEMMSVVRPDGTSIEYRIAVAAKDSSNAPHNGWADAVAYLWRPMEKERDARLRVLSDVGLLDRWLLRLDHTVLGSLGRTVDDPANITADDFVVLIDTLAQTPIPFAAEFASERLAGVATDAAVRAVLLHALHRALMKPSPDLEHAARMMEWIDTHAKPDEFKGLEALSWANDRLALQNHRGRFDLETVDAVESIALELFDEYPILACEALLRTVVACTNELALTTAAMVADHLLERRARLPLREIGRALSQRAQVHALNHEYSAAIACFDEALACFDRMTAREVGAVEAQRTAVYRLHASAYEPSVPDAEVRQRGAALAGGRGIADLCHIDPLSGDRWVLHAVLRCAVARPSLGWDHCLLEIAVPAADELGVPWPQIGLNCALLALRHNDRQAAGGWFDAAHRFAARGNPGITLRYIAAVIAVSARAAGTPLSVGNLPIGDAVLADSPLHANAARLRDLYRASSRTRTPAEIVREFLPFNFG